MAAETTEYVLATAREADVKFIRLWFTDILGSLKSFAITIGELRSFDSDDNRPEHQPPPSSAIA